MHVFEQAGLGSAPFKLVGYERMTFRANPDAPEQVGGSCDYCSTGTKDAFWIAAADGRKFKVGCDCVRKTGDASLVRQVDAEAKRIKAAAKAKKDAVVIAEARAILDARQDMLTNTAHPTIAGKTLRDYAEWMMINAGTTGKLKVAKIILRAA